MELSLYIDIRTKALKKSNSSKEAAPLPIFTQGETIDLYVYFLRPAATIAAVDSLVDITGHTLETALGLRDPDAAKSTPSIYQNSFSVNSTLNRFEGDLTLTESACETLLGTAKKVEVQFSLLLGDGTNERAFTFDATLEASVIPSSTSTPAAPTQYYTKVAADNVFAKKEMAAGEGIIIKSPDNSQWRMLQLQNDGSVQWLDVTP